MEETQDQINARKVFEVMKEQDGFNRPAEKIDMTILVISSAIFAGAFFDYLYSLVSNEFENCILSIVFMIIAWVGILRSKSDGRN